MTTRRHRLDDVAHLPCHLRYPHAALVHDLDVVVRVCHDGCARSIILVAVVAVGGSGEAAGSVVVDDGGGVGMEPLLFVCWLLTTTN